jgi:nucleoside-diphosphate-sugar epimerase
MGALGPLVVTGAGGFVGRAVVAEARRRGHAVRALYRSAAAPEWQGDAGVAALRLDLAAPEADLAPAVAGAAAVIHAAAHLGGDPQAHLRDTLAATQAVTRACAEAGARLVLISSIAVYDSDRLSPGALLTEESPRIALPPEAQAQPARALEAARDPYAGAKRLQEAMAEGLGGLSILRPGVVWGPGRSWHALQGFRASKLFVTLTSEGELPLTHVDHLARVALGCAAAGAPRVLNVFDADRPTRARFLRAHRRAYGWPRLNAALPYGLWAALARGLRPLSARLPGLLREPVLRARIMPLRYDDSALRRAFPGDDAAFETLMARTREAEQ